MQSFVAKFGLPLLTRELIQKSTHTRTYVIRVIYAAVLYATALYQYRRWTGQLPDSFAALGEGLPLFELLVDWQYAAIYLFLPLMTCGTITVEKERQTLMLLKLTKLSGWTILIEKLASRLMEFGIFLMLSFPLGAVAYGLGGVEVDDLLNAACNVMVMAVLVGCFSLFMSTWFRTTAGAMIGVYLFGVAIKLGGPPLIRPVLLGALRLGLVSLSWFGLETDGQTLFTDIVHQYLDTHGIPTASSQGFFDTDSDSDLDLTLGWLNPVPPAVPPIRTWSATAIASLPQFVLSLFFLVLARLCLWRRAESRPSQFLRNCFITLDSMFKAINHNRITRGITFGKQGADLPTREPISWYETRRRLVGRTPYLVRVLLAIEVPLIMWFAWCARVAPMQLAERLQIAWEWGWMLAVLVIVAISTGVVAVERSRQTLDVLLTTPLNSTDIVTQKMAGVWRWVFVMSVPLFTVLFLQVAGRTWFSTDGQTPLTEYYLLNYVDEAHASLSGLVFHGNLAMLVLRRSAAILIYLPLVAWLGFQFGVRLKNQWRAILALCLPLAILCNMSTILNLLTAMRSPLEQAELYYGLRAWLKWLDPQYVIAGNAENDYLQTDLLLDSDILPLEWFPFLFHFLIVGGMLWTVRRNAFRSFSRFVGRLEPATGRPVRIRPVEASPVFTAIQIPEAGEVQLFDAEPTTSSPRTKND